MRLPWAVALLAVLGARYLLWRLTSTLNTTSTTSLFFSVLLLLAECWLLIHAGLQLVLSLAPDQGSAERIARAEQDLRRRRADHGWQPAVDVLVPTCGEPFQLIERCLRGCCHLDYPDCTVWLLDDACRSELQDLCADLGCRYLARSTHGNAKAGNLNHALPFLQGDLIAIFDADVVPLESFLSRTVGLFFDPAVALVQTPQTYMNADPVIRNLRLENWLLPDEEVFYRWIEPVRQRVKAVVCAGTSFLIRRTALVAVGGFDPSTSSEDLATGIRVVAAAGAAVYVPEKLSAGLAPLTSGALVRQRCRWASGTLQLLRTGASPLSIHGLQPLQRIAFLEGVLHWLNVGPQLVLVLMPLCIGLFGVMPMQLTGAALLSHALPFYGSQMILTRWFSAHARTALLPEIYRWFLFGPLLVVVSRFLLCRPLTFQVTPKTLEIRSSSRGRRSLLLPLGLLFGLQLWVCVQLLRLGGQPSVLLESQLSVTTLVIIWFWSLLNAVLLLAAIRICSDRSRADEVITQSPVPWFSLQQQALLAQRPVRVTAISEHGVELQQSGDEGSLPRPLLEQTQILQLPAGRRGVLRLPVRLHHSKASKLGCVWATLTPAQHDDLHWWLYRRPGLWPQRRAPLEPLSFLVLVWRLLRPMRPEGWFQRSMVSINPLHP